MLSDEQYEQACEDIADALGRYGFDDDNLRAFEADDLFHDLIAAVGAALLPEVTPLGPGDYVDIGASLRAFHDVEDGDFGVMVWDDDEGGARFVDERIAYLDAAGVRALRTTCDRFLAGLEGDDDE